MLNLTISSEHPDANNRLLHAAAQVLQRMGARVEISVGAENMVRNLTKAERGDLAQDPRPTAVVSAEGLPNLLHELVHAVQSGRLDDDYGIDYSAIPFDLTTVTGRAVLWEELACCTLSCAYMSVSGRAAVAGADLIEVRTEVEDWFREQVEILPVFYGLEHDPPAFIRRVAALLGRHGDEADAIGRRAREATARALRAAGAEPSLAVPPPMTVHDLWPLVADRIGPAAECA